MTNEISKYLTSRIEARDFPSAVYLIAEKGEIALQDAVGMAVVAPEPHVAAIDTIYDLASLTKPLVTGLFCARLIESGRLNLTDRVADHFAEFDTDEKRGITIKHLVTHTSGFKAWLPFYLVGETPQIDSHNYMGFIDEKIRTFVLNEIARQPCANAAGSSVVYSDLNFILLGLMIENIYGQRLQGIVAPEFDNRLGLTQTFFGGTNTLRRETAASEKGNAFERQTCIDMGFLTEGRSSPILRKDQIWGEVHDCNAYFMGGVAGHAGLFSTAAETFKIASQFLPGSTTMLDPATCELFCKDLTPGMNEHRSLSFQLASTPESTAGSRMSAQSFGHLGFTGTSLWIDPKRERIFILLTNRTHDRELPFANINAVRRQFHDLGNEFLDKD